VLHNLPVTRARSHLAPFLEGPAPYIVIARNAIPVAVVLWFEGSIPFAIFLVWFDGLTALIALITMHVLGSRHESKPDDLPDAVGWLVSIGLLGAPYWFGLFLFDGGLLPEGFWTGELLAPWAVVAMIAVLAGHLYDQSRRGYARMRRSQRHGEFNWDYQVLLARIMLILIAGFFLRSLYFLVAIACALSYLEIYPLRALRILGHAPFLDESDERRSRD
jgi:hypothetical protein